MSRKWKNIAVKIREKNSSRNDMFYIIVPRLICFSL